MEGDGVEELLRENLKLNAENNKILKKIHNHIRWGRAMKALYWVIVIGSALGVYYFLQPLIENIISIYRDIALAGGELKEFMSSFSNLFPRDAAP